MRRAVRVSASSHDVGPAMILLSEEMDLLRRLMGAGGHIEIPSHASLEELKALFALINQKLIRVEETSLSLTEAGRFALEWAAPRLEGKVWVVEGPSTDGDSPLDLGASDPLSSEPDGEEREGG